MTRMHSLNRLRAKVTELTAESEALEQRMSDALEAHRADCRTRYGYDFGEKVS